MWFLKVVGPFLRGIEVLVGLFLAGTAAFLFFAVACMALVGSPAGASPAPSFLLTGGFVGSLLAAAAVPLLWRRRLRRRSRPDLPALPDPGPRWADRPGARPPDAIRPDQRGLSEHPGSGAERGEAT
jgi:hypothetical protein